MTITTDRDALAAVRTHLANERTLLAYGRTALMLAASGVTLVKLDGGQWSLLPIELLSAAGGVLVIGMIRFVLTRQRIR